MRCWGRTAAAMGAWPGNCSKCLLLLLLLLGQALSQATTAEFLQSNCAAYQPTHMRLVEDYMSQFPDSFSVADVLRRVVLRRILLSSQPAHNTSTHCWAIPGFSYRHAHQLNMPVCSQGSCAAQRQPPARRDGSRAAAAVRHGWGAAHGQVGLHWHCPGA